jgi:very-short-patch-repair endonuclease
MKSCNHCHINFPTKIFANHVRWCTDDRSDAQKYHPLCSCLVCKQELVIQNLNAHYLRHYKTFGNCKNCNKLLTQKQQFCSRSCSAKHNNNQIKEKRNKGLAKKPGPQKGYKPKNIQKKISLVTNIKLCMICKKYHKKKSKTCSNECKKILLAQKIKERIDAGWNPQQNRNRSTPSFLETSFEKWLNDNDIFSPLYVKNKTFRCGKKIYFGDFFFPSVGILIELDGSQHENTKEYDFQRDVDILNYHNVKTLRIPYKEYFAKTKIKDVQNILKML